MSPDISIESSPDISKDTDEIHTAEMTFTYKTHIFGGTEQAELTTINPYIAPITKISAEVHAVPYLEPDQDNVPKNTTGKLGEPSEIDQGHEETKWIKSWLNTLYHSLWRWGADRRLVRLIHPYAVACTKVKQMEAARDFFPVPEWMLHFGFEPTPRRVIAKNLIGRTFEAGSAMMAGIVDRAMLDPAYPWFTQEIAPGTHDATVLYVDGRVHPYRFATPRGKLTDWRVTQGTDANQWVPWDAPAGFDDRVRNLMDRLGLKFGRLDFIVGEESKPQFLEVNPSGQFGWLDEDGPLPLHHEVVSAILDPATTLEGRFLS